MTDFFSYDHISWTQFWHVLLLMMFWCIGFYTVTREDMIFGFYERWLNRLPEKLSFPMGNCIFCMASLHGGVVFTAYCFVTGAQFTITNMAVGILASVISSPVQAFLYNLFDYVDTKRNDDE